MFKGEDYLHGNPEIVRKALEHYIKKLESMLQKKELKPTTKALELLISTITKRIEEILATLDSGDINQISRLVNSMDFIKSALRVYQKDLMNEKDAMKEEFHDEIMVNDLNREFKAVSDAFERLDKI